MNLFKNIFILLTNSNEINGNKNKSSKKRMNKSKYIKCIWFLIISVMTDNYHGMK